MTNTLAASALKNSVHSSIRPSPLLPKYYGAACKYYYLPLRPDSRFPPRIAGILGAENKGENQKGQERTRAAIQSSLEKAHRGQFSHVKIPFDREGDTLAQYAAACAEARGLRVVAQISSSLLHHENYAEFIFSLPRSYEVELLLDGECAPPAGSPVRLQSHFREVHASIAVHRDLLWSHALSEAITSRFPEIHLYFAYQLKAGTPYLSCVESRRLLLRLRKLYSQVKFLPPKGVDLWDRRVKGDFELEPNLAPCFETSSANAQIKYSVVIPTYNNQNHLRVTLRHLFEQDVGPDAFEIIVVDDGGTDQTQALVLQLMAAQAVKYNFKYIYLPRPKKRAMGDAQFRAGIARNLGVKNAIGENLCFLDSDIVTPPNYLREVGLQLITWGGLQAKRVNLKQKVSHLECRYEQVKLGQDTDPDEKYWEEFKQTPNWHLLPYNWKYVCTHSFSMRRDLFWQLGGFKRNYIFYGFEDTDLGYRITKSGHPLHLLDLTVFHLFHETTRSEFMNLNSFRHNLLSRTAQIFYLHHLDDDIFENLRGFMNPEPTFARLWHQARDFFSLSFLWKPRPAAFLLPPPPTAHESPP